MFTRRTRANPEFRRGIDTDASLNSGFGYSGTGGLGDPETCEWEQRMGATVPGVVYVQDFRPRNKGDAHCSL